jgi:hypothetical protein
VTRDRPRWWEWATERRIFCGPRPDGHHFANNFRVPESTFLHCTHKFANSVVRCDRWVFVLTIRGGGTIVAEVSLDEMNEMHELQTPTAMLDYLKVFQNQRAG